MSEWPQLDELKQVLNVESTDWDGDDASYEPGTRLTALLDAAIAKVKQDVGLWDEYVDLPDDALSRAALRLAELMALKPEVLAAVTRGAIVADAAYQAFLYGHRREFGIA